MPRRASSAACWKTLGQPINVVNRTGGSGVVGHQAIASSAPDGYTLGIATVEIGMMHWQGLTQLTYADYTPLALMNEDPAGLQVAAQSIQLGQGPAGGDPRQAGHHEGFRHRPGSIWHLALAGVLGKPT